MSPLAEDGATASVSIATNGPPVPLSALGLLAPGTPQFLIGETIKGGAFAGGTVALGIGSYLALRQIFYPESFQPNAFFPGESHALIIVNAVGLSWLTGGILSALDAYVTLQDRQPQAPTSPAPAESPTPQPTARPSARPTLAPTQQPTTPPTWAPEPTPQSTPTLTPAPRWTPRPTPTPQPTPTPAAGFDPEAAVYQAYDYAGKGQYLHAVMVLQPIRDPDWLPKANALMTEWGPKAVDQGLALARARLAEGDRDTAREILTRISTFPKTAAQARSIEAMRQGLR